MDLYEPNYMRKAIQWAKGMAQQGTISNSQVPYMALQIAKARQTHRDEEVVKAIKALKYAKFRRNTMFEIESLFFSEVEKQPRKEEFPNEVSQEQIQDEIEYDAILFNVIKFDRQSFMGFGEKWNFTEPNSKATEHIGLKDYKDNTWISVFREAQERRTSVPQMCREKGLLWDYLLM